MGYYPIENTYYSLGHFSLNKTGNDLSNYKNHGGLVNVTFGSDHYNNPNSALDFSTSDKSIAIIPNSKMYNFGYSNFSIA